jgi:hypothetical protein
MLAHAKMLINKNHMSTIGAVRTTVALLRRQSPNQQSSMRRLAVTNRPSGAKYANASHLDCIINSVQYAQHSTLHGYLL